VVLARPNGLYQCQNLDCGIYYRPSERESKYCPVCIKEGTHIKPRKCAYGPCEVVWRPRHGSALYHSDSCRQLAYAARKKAVA
jgi:hypothetical protein